MKKTIVLLLFFFFPAHSISAQTSDAPAPLPKASKSQIAEWISQHVVAWDEATKLTANSDQCRLQILRNNKSTIMNFSGVLFPIEVFAKKNTNNAYVRVRFKDRYSGDYGMERVCNKENNFCKDNIGKWSPVSFYDFTVTDIRAYEGRNNDINIKKSRKLARALTHFARLCNSTDYNFTF